MYIYIYQSIYLSIDAWGARWDRHCAIGYGGVVLIGATTLRLGMWRNEQNSKRSSAPYIYLSASGHPLRVVSSAAKRPSAQHLSPSGRPPPVVHKRSSALNAPYNDLIAA